MTKDMFYVTEHGETRSYDFSNVKDEDLPDVLKKCFKLAHDENIHPAYGLDNEYYHMECQDILMTYLKRTGQNKIADMYLSLTDEFWYA